MTRRLLVLALALSLMVPTIAFGADYGVYVKAAESVKVSFDEAVKQTEEALEAGGWEVLASYAAGVEKRCGTRAHTVVFTSDDYEKQVMTYGPRAAFALPLRAAVYENASGINVAFVNPASINRTIIGDEASKAFSPEVARRIAADLGAGFGESSVSEQIGQVRDEGYVGGMGGGEFAEKIEVVQEGGQVADIAARVEESIKSATNGWRMVYRLEPSGAQKAVIFGLTKEATEARAYDIAGEKRESRSDKCPGLDHAPAFPIEMIVYEEGGRTKLVTMDEMYRMKLYFEDAGKWAFMKNMTMPGQIEDEVIEASSSKLK